MIEIPIADRRSVDKLKMQLEGLESQLEWVREEGLADLAEELSSALEEVHFLMLEVLAGTGRIPVTIQVKTDDPEVRLDRAVRLRLERLDVHGVVVQTDADGFFETTLEPETPYKVTALMDHVDPWLVDPPQPLTFTTPAELDPLVIELIFEKRVPVSLQLSTNDPDLPIEEVLQVKVQKLGEEGFYVLESDASGLISTSFSTSSTYTLTPLSDTISGEPVELPAPIIVVTDPAPALPLTLTLTYGAWVPVSINLLTNEPGTPIDQAMSLSIKMTDGPELLVWSDLEGRHLVKLKPGTEYTIQVLTDHLHGMSIDVPPLYVFTTDSEPILTTVNLTFGVWLPAEIQAVFEGGEVPGTLWLEVVLGDEDPIQIPSDPAGKWVTTMKPGTAYSIQALQTSIDPQRFDLPQILTFETGTEPLPQQWSLTYRQRVSLDVSFSFSDPDGLCQSLASLSRELNFSLTAVGEDPERVSSDSHGQFVTTLHPETAYQLDFDFLDLIWHGYVLKQVSPVTFATATYEDPVSLELGFEVASSEITIQLKTDDLLTPIDEAMSIRVLGNDRDQVFQTDGSGFLTLKLRPGIGYRITAVTDTLHGMPIDPPAPLDLDLPLIPGPESVNLVYSIWVPFSLQYALGSGSITTPFGFLLAYEGEEPKPYATDETGSFSITLKPHSTYTLTSLSNGLDPDFFNVPPPLVINTGSGLTPLVQTLTFARRVPFSTQILVTDPHHLRFEPPSATEVFQLWLTPEDGYPILAETDESGYFETALDLDQTYTLSLKTDVFEIFLLEKPAPITFTTIDFETPIHHDLACGLKMDPLVCDDCFETLYTGVFDPAQTSAAPFGTMPPAGNWEGGVYTGGGKTILIPFENTSKALLADTAGETVTAFGDDGNSYYGGVYVGAGKVLAFPDGEGGPLLMDVHSLTSEILFEWFESNYSGGVYVGDGKALAIPADPSSQPLLIDIQAKTGTAFGECPGSYYGGVYVGGGKVIAIPSSFSQTLLIDTIKQTITPFGPTFSGSYRGGVYVGGGRVAAIPYSSASRPLLIDAVAKTVTPFASSPGSYFGGVYAGDGKVVAIPYSSTYKPLLIDTKALTAATFGQAAGGSYRSGVYLGGGKILAAPYSASSRPLIIDLGPSYHPGGDLPEAALLSAYFNKF